MLHAWSLSVEEQFYLVWPILLVVAMRRGRALLVLGILFGASLLGGFLFSADPTAVFFLMPFRVYELALGGMLVWVVSQVRPRNALLEGGLVIGLALIIAAVVTFNEATPFPVNGLVPCLGAALVIVCGTAPRLGILLRNPVAVRIGLISYSVYLVHWPIVVFYRYVVRDELNQFERLAIVAAALIGGLAMHHAVEIRYRYPRPGTATTRRFVAAAAGVAVVVVGLGLSASASGWPWRLGDREVAFQHARSFYGGDGCGPAAETLEKVHTCEFGEGRALVVMGDSHALQYVAGLKKALPDREVMVFESDSCFMFSFDKTRLFPADQADYDPPCRATKEAAFAAIRRTNADVIVAQNWSKTPMESETTPEHWSFRLDADWARFAGRELQGLKETLAIKHLLVLGNVPTPGGAVSPVDCLSRPVRLGDAGCEATPLANDIVSSKHAFNAALRTSVEPFAFFEDPFDYLCDADACRNLADGKALYSSKTHLSKPGSEFVIAAMAAHASEKGDVLQ